MVHSELSFSVIHHGDELSSSEISSPRTNWGRADSPLLISGTFQSSTDLEDIDIAQSKMEEGERIRNEIDKRELIRAKQEKRSSDNAEIQSWQVSENDSAKVSTERDESQSAHQPNSEDIMHDDSRDDSELMS